MRAEIRFPTNARRQRRNPANLDCSRRAIETGVDRFPSSGNLYNSPITTRVQSVRPERKCATGPRRTRATREPRRHPPPPTSTAAETRAHSRDPSVAHRADPVPSPSRGTTRWGEKREQRPRRHGGVQANAGRMTTNKNKNEKKMRASVPRLPRRTTPSPGEPPTPATVTMSLSTDVHGERSARHLPIVNAK